MSPCDLDLRSLDLELLPHFSIMCFKVCAKFERNRIIRGWVIDDLTLFRRAILEGGGRWSSFTERFSGVRGPNFTLLSRGIGRLFLQKFVSSFVYLAAFSNEDGKKLSDVEKYAKFRTFWLPLWKSGEGCARSLEWTNCWTYDRTSGIHLMTIYCAAAEGGLFKKTKKVD